MLRPRKGTLDGIGTLLSDFVQVSSWRLAAQNATQQTISVSANINLPEVLELHSPILHFEQHPIRRKSIPFLLSSCPRLLRSLAPFFNRIPSIHLGHELLVFPFTFIEAQEKNFLIFLEVSKIFIDSCSLYSSLVWGIIANRILLNYRCSIPSSWIPGFYL